MNILLTNDDGIGAEGIAVLSRILSKEHSIYIVAPKANRSGASCQMNCAVPLELGTADKAALLCEAAYSLDGSPVDCVLSALKGSYVPVKVDAVVSGINHGPNIGTDIIYSGTCGGARHASLSGIPGIALSIDSGVREKGDESGSLYFEEAALFALKNLGKLISLCGKAVRLDSRHTYFSRFVNVNIPALKAYKGARLTVPCIRRYWESVQVAQECGKWYSRTDGADVLSFGDENSDSAATESGYVSVSVIRAEPSAAETDSCAAAFAV